jgi:methylenetetrahydrofolate dehydrogenase (NADP+)/methenyltetrahydrofolate cyclohydrolase
VIGRSSIVDKPMAALLTAASATVTIAPAAPAIWPRHVFADIVVAALAYPAW